ncbi:MAG TPA: PAS domain-containing protein [Pirellulales bacterium]|nr:PAS domain-containing protein [Pirellulales bacterium]
MSAEEELESLRQRVDELERLLERQRESEAGRDELLSMLSYVPDTVYMLDRQGRFLYLNRVRDDFKISELLGASAYDYVWPDHQARFRDTIERIYATGEPQRYEIRAANTDGDWSWYSCLLGPVWRTGEIVAVAGAAANVDELKAVQESLERANDELEMRVAERTRDLEQANEVLRREAAQRLEAERARQEERRLLELVLDSMDVGVVIADRQGRLTRINPAAAKTFGVRPGNADGFQQRWSGAAYLPDGSGPYPADQHPLLKALRGESVGGEEILFLQETELQAIWLQVSARPLIDGEGTRYGALLIFRDVTLQKRALIALRETEQRFVSILENTPAVVYLKDSAGRYMLVNRAFEDAFQLPSEAVVGRADHELFDGATAEQLEKNDRQVLRSGQAYQFEETVPVGGVQRTYLSVKFPLPDARESRYALCGISTDINERKQAEERLQSEQTFLRHLIRAHEHDRQLMSCEIHDGLVQYMSASLMHLDCLTTEPQISKRGQNSLELARHLVRRSVVEGRRVMSGLRPQILDDEGIVSAISFLVAEQASPGELDIEYDHQVNFDRLDSLLEGTLFRIAQEALTNVKRHSKSAKARVRLQERGHHIYLEISDWGQGFDPANVMDDRFGLKGIRKRADLLGGRAQIVSQAGFGTTISVSLPLKPDDVEREPSASR